MRQPNSAFGVAARLGLATTVLMFGLIVIGSVVRTTGSGLACPDWPLCHGQLIPPFQFNVLIEWFHRLVALLVSLLLAATVGFSVANRQVRARLGGLAALAVLLLLVQILLGALTVWKLLHPSVVSSHLAVALLLFTTMLVLSLIARAGSGRGIPAGVARPPGLLATFTVTGAMVFGQALLGGIVSTNHAGLACPDWPTCGGEWFPGIEGLVGLQVIHRYGAYLLTAAMIVTAVRSRSAGDPAVRAGGSLALGLTLCQVAIGVANVFLGVPVWVSALHLGMAAAILAVMVTLTVRVAMLPARARAMAATVAS
jgi:cytochrome c oxidase assembly protein subunit 15